MVHHAPTFNKSDATDNELGVAVWRVFCHGRRYVKVEPQERNGNFEFKYHTFYIRPGTFKPGLIFSHEIGHVLEATDDELFVLNLGMGDQTKPQVDSVSDEARVGGAWREANVLAYQLRVAELAGKPIAPVFKDRVSAIFGSMVSDKKGWAAKLEAKLAEAPDVLALWEKKMTLIRLARASHKRARSRRLVGAA